MAVSASWVATKLTAEDLQANPSLLSALASDLGQDSVRVEALDAQGLQNNNFKLVGADSTCFFLRVYAPPDAASGLDAPRRERTALEWAATHNLGLPRLLCWHPAGDLIEPALAVTSWVDGAALSPQELNESTLASIAELLKAVHDAPPPSNDDLGWELDRELLPQTALPSAALREALSPEHSQLQEGLERAYGSAEQVAGRHGLFFKELPRR